MAAVWFEKYVFADLEHVGKAAHGEYGRHGHVFGSAGCFAKHPVLLKGSEPFRFPIVVC